MVTTRRADAISRTVVVVAGLAPLFLALYLWRRTLLQELTVEDGVLEYLSAVLFFVAAGAFAHAGLSGRHRKIWVLPLAIVCCFVAGEEVSWGQRLLGIGTPESLRSVNVQGETNLHNIEGVHGIVRAVAVLVLLSVFALLPLADRHWRVVRRVNEKLRVPVPPLLTLVLVLIGIAYMAVPRLLGVREHFALDEVGEFYVAVAWLLYACSAASAPRRRAEGRGQVAEGLNVRQAR